MKKAVSVALIALYLLIGCGNTAWAGEMEMLVKKLVEKGILTPNEAQTLVADAKEESAKEMAKAVATTAPEWTQKIKIKGDVRLREQVDWGKPVSPAGQEIRTRVRARLGVEGTVNDQIKAGARLVTGSSSDPRSTNQTLTDNFEKYSAWFDQFYVVWSPKLPSDIGSAKVWGGKFENPMFVSDMFWDSDINPGGGAAQYVSPVFDIFDTTQANLFANGGLLWLDELATNPDDPMMWVVQGGMEMTPDTGWDTNVKTAIGFFAEVGLKDQQADYANISEHSSGTNTRWVTADGAGLTTSYRKDFRMLDWVTNIDNKKFLDYELPHGIYTDLLWNTAATQKNMAVQAGGYLGKKSPKDQGDWKLFGEYRYLERDSILDYLPDSDFPGFTTTGAAALGGTNCQGVSAGIQYALLKDVVLYLEYDYAVALSTMRAATTGAASNQIDDPYQLFQADIVVKF